MVIFVLYLIVAFGIATYLYYTIIRFQRKGMGEEACDYANSIQAVISSNDHGFLPYDAFDGGGTTHFIIWTSAILWPVNIALILYYLIRKIGRS